MRDKYETVYDRSLELIQLGHTTLDSVLNAVPRPPEEFERQREAEIEASNKEPIVAPAEEPIRVSNAVFRVRSDGAEPPPAEVSGANGHANGHGELNAEDEESKLLLIIDDDPDQRSILKRVLEMAGLPGFISNGFMGFSSVLSFRRLLLHPLLPVNARYIYPLPGSEVNEPNLRRWIPRLIYRHNSVVQEWFRAIPSLGVDAVAFGIKRLSDGIYFLFRVRLWQGTDPYVMR